MEDLPRLTCDEAEEAIDGLNADQVQLLLAIYSNKVRAKNLPADRIGMTGDMGFVRLDIEKVKGIGKTCTVAARNLVQARLAELNPISPRWLKLPTNVVKAMKLKGLL